MSFDKHKYYIDLSKMPEEQKKLLKAMADKHNALVDVVGDNKNSVDDILGVTPEERSEMINIFSKIRRLVGILHEKRLDGFLLTGQMFMVIYFLKALGVETEQVNRFINLILNMSEKMMGINI
jgi:hypothetical protein